MPALVRAWNLKWHQAVRAFDITRPMFGDLDNCSKTATCTRQVDGTAQPWHVDGGVNVINAKRQGSTIDASQNGLRPTNVPD